MLREFKTFIMRGNVLDLAIGIVIGAAFGRIVTSFVNDLLMPPIGLLLGRIDSSNLFVPLRGGPYPSLAAAKAAGAPTFNYGLFLNTVIDFLIVAFVIFLIVRVVNWMAALGAHPDDETVPLLLHQYPRAGRAVSQLYLRAQGSLIDANHRCPVYSRSSPAARQFSGL